MKKRCLLAFCITIIIVLLLSATVFLQEFSSSIPKDTLLSVTATGKQSKNSWGQSVRISSVLVNDEPVDLEILLPFCDGFSMKNGFLASHQYPAALNVTLENAKRIELHLLGDDGSGFADICLGNQKKEVDLYRQGGWHTINWTLTNTSGFAPHRHPLKLSLLSCLIYPVVFFFLHISAQKRGKNLLSGLFLLAGLFLLGFYVRQQTSADLVLSSSFFRTLENPSTAIPVFILLFSSLFPYLPCWILWSLCIAIATELLSVSGSLFLLPTHAVYLNILVIAAVGGIAVFLIGNAFLSSCIASMALFFGALSNHYTLQFRGSPVSITDIPALKTALDVLGNYTLDLHPNILISVLLFAAGLLVIFPLKHKRIRFPARFGCALLSVLFIISLNTGKIQNKLGISHEMWNINYQCKDDGFWLTFFDRISLSFISKPDGFSDKTVKELEKKYSGVDSIRDNFRPNVIVVMNESFSDLENYDGFSASEPIAPFLQRLKGLPNTHYGYVQVPVMGGSTSTSEFEFLSGMNLLHYPISSPYDLLGKNIPALPEAMKTLGYTSVALHPYSSTSWSRNKGLPKIGFDRSIFENTGMHHQEKVRGYISDQSFYDEIIMLDQQTQEPLFLFGITMQNHGGYYYAPFDEPIRITSPAGNYPLATQYINLIRESDRAFESFIDYYEKQEEPTIVLFFGDHLPKIEEDLLDCLHASYLPQSGHDKLVQYHTPYYIWANFDLDKSQLPAEGALISLSLLQSVLIKASDLPMTGYQQFLLQLLDQYPVISQRCILDSDGNSVDTQISEIPILKDYIDLQYALFQNKGDLFTFHH